MQKQFFLNLRDEAARVGYVQALWRTVYYLLNKRICYRRLNVIRLGRENLVPLNPAKYALLSSRLATEQELLKMQAEGIWDLSDELLANFRAGDACLLSYVGDKLAGYTWVHLAGRPRWLEGLTVRIPEGYGYNYAGFTLPAFRGYGLQPYRHHEVMNRPEWRDRIQGMIGYVECTNWSSQKGQAKSGYQKIGVLTLVGTKRRFFSLFSRELRKLGMGRI